MIHDAGYFQKCIRVDAWVWNRHFQAEGWSKDHPTPERSSFRGAGRHIISHHVELFQNLWLSGGLRCFPVRWDPILLEQLMPLSRKTPPNRNDSRKSDHKESKVLPLCPIDKIQHQNNSDTDTWSSNPNHFEPETQVRGTHAPIKPAYQLHVYRRTTPLDDGKRGKTGKTRRVRANMLTQPRFPRICITQ